MSTHTPGPWKVISRAGYSGHCVADNYTRSVAAFPSNSKRDETERDANARLIAAAPDLLAALQDIIGLAEAHSRKRGRNPIAQASVDASMAVARAAIAKAEGTS
jgi:23S rRNA maturation mini-RNase III